MGEVLGFKGEDDYASMIEYILSLYSQGKLKGVAFSVLISDEEGIETQAGWVKSHGVSLFEMMGSVNCLQQRLYEEVNA